MPLNNLRQKLKSPLMSPNELPKAYDPKKTDSKWVAFWEKANFFQANPDSKKPPFSLVIPPPNVTGVLHMGHALVNTLQDILARYKRMSGFETLWVPGTDHAGIATQTVVERDLATKGKRRSDFSREEFVKIVWQWKEKSEKVILNQLKSLGCSCDWSRLRFTMDEGCNLAVKTIFKKLYEDGLIYRGNYLVNWDPTLQTALADDEVEYEERESFLWTFRYLLCDGTGYIRIATTRPETMLGDTAVAVSPKDERFKHLIGQSVWLPILDRKLPIIADSHVDPEFGTGIVKITPAHDPNDYKIGLNHRLPFINILTPTGLINENGGPYKGMTREEARESIIKQMKELGLFEKVDRHILRVGVSYRSKAVIEPYLSKQWFVKMDTFAEVLKRVSAKGEVKILPKIWESTYFNWIHHLRDWCISRQLWWGHRIPVWYRKDDPENIICYAGEGLPPEVEKNPDLWEQDPDVLDTWFSSALWPFSTLGWPDETQDLKKFYPTSTLITGHDILFFWVTRMICMGEYAMGKPPFPETFLHGLIYGKSYFRKNKDGSITYIAGEEKKQYDLGKEPPSDVQSKWEKLSKSKGNVIDPMELIEEYGTDALRMTLCAIANQSPQIDLDRRKFEEFKNFANKVWNGARFVFMNLEGLSDQIFSRGLDEKCFSLEDHWILSQLNRASQTIRKFLEVYSFEQAATLAYNFFWNEFCSKYVEIVKPVLFGKKGTPEEKTNKQKILVILLSQTVRLLHPMAPFITEELFQLLKERFPKMDLLEESDPYTKETIQALLKEACAVSDFPKAVEEKDVREEIESRFSFIEKIVHAIRNIRGEMKIPPSVETEVYLVGPFNEETNIIEALVKTKKIEIVSKAPQFGLSASAQVDNIAVVIPLPQELAEQEKTRLEKEEEKLMKTAVRLKELFANPEFLEKANPELIDKQKKTLAQTEKEIKTIREKLSILR